jgi:hypothetical protein
MTGRMVSGLIVFPSDIEAEQARTLASAQATDTAVQACTTLPADTKTEWTAFYTTLTAFCSLPVCVIPFPGRDCLLASANAGDSMLAYENELQAWQKRLSGVCTNAGPSLTTFNPNPAGEQATQWLRYLALIAGFAGTAYAISEVAGLLSLFKPARTAKEGRRR